MDRFVIIIKQWAPTETEWDSLWVVLNSSHFKNPGTPTEYKGLPGGLRPEALFCVRMSQPESPNDLSVWHKKTDG